MPPSRVEQRGLARAAGAEERDPLARRDRQVDAAQRDDVVAAEGPVEVDDALAADSEAARPRVAPTVASRARGPAPGLPLVLNNERLQRYRPVADVG